MNKTSRTTAAHQSRAKVPTLTRAATVLTSRGFLLAIGLLLLNDWVLKFTVGSWWTGKLSDFAGLYAFPLFWSAFFPQRGRAIYGTTAVCFLIWKSSVSEPLLAAWNAAGLWPVTRVVDYTDWIALIVLLPSFWSAQRLTCATTLTSIASARRIGAISSAVVAMVAFAATSRRAPSYDFVPQPGYFIAGARDRVLISFEAHGWNRLSSDRQHRADADTLSVILDANSRTWIAARVELRDAPTCGTVATLLSIQTMRKTPDLLAIRELFFSRLIEPFQSQYTAC